VRRGTRILGTLLLAAGTLTLVWVIVVWRWQDPLTALYTHYEQQQLARAYVRRAATFHRRLARHDLVSVRASVAAEARAYARTLRRGDPFGRITIGRIGLKMMVVQGTDHDSLTRGPGHYLSTGLPGEGRLIYIAGHRTTYLAPFSDINDIRVGDYISLQVPYGTFTYRVVSHYVVSDADVAVLRNTGRELLRLQACHPRFFATHRYIVDARLVGVAPTHVTRATS
jgi:sortase A